jgi:hypothetical protein
MGNESWRSSDDQLRTIEVTVRELHLLQRLRQLGEGLHLTILLKVTKGRDGLEDFKVQESIPAPKEKKNK